MAYSAIEKMRKKNEQIYGKDVGPTQPALSDGAATGFDLKSAVLRFLHERCEGVTRLFTVLTDCKNTAN